MRKDIEQYVATKVAEAKLQVADQRNEFIWKIVTTVFTILFAVFGIIVPWLTKNEFEKQYKNLESKIDTKISDLENRYDQKPEIVVTYRNSKMKNNQEIDLNCDSLAFFKVENNGHGRADFLRTVLFYSEQQYLSSNPMQVFWSTEATTKDTAYVSMFNKFEEYFNPGDDFYIPVLCPCLVQEPNKFKSYLKITADKSDKYEIKFRCLDIKKQINQ